jgi:hypothetical protein
MNITRVPHPPYNPDESIESPNIDAVSIGEGEKAV